MKTLRLPVCAAAFMLAAGAIAWGVLSDAREARLQSLLASIEGAEDRVSYTGTRLLIGSETIKLRVWSSEGRKKLEFLGVDGGAKPPPPPRAPRIPFFGGVPAFLRPGHDQWKRKIKDLALAVRNYDITIAGRSVVAGRDVELIDLRPRHEGRPGYRIAADLENRFPLRFEVLAEGKTVFETRFSEIEYHPALAAGFFDEPRRPSWLNVAREEIDPSRASAAAGFAVFRPAELPAGFEARGSELYRVRAELPKEMRGALPFPVPKLDATVLHLRYTDGLAAVAVVECSATSEFWKVLQRFLPPGEGSAEGRVVARKFSDRGGVAYLLELEGTVVLVAGNVAAEQIESMIRTLERR